LEEEHCVVNYKINSLKREKEDFCLTDNKIEQYLGELKVLMNLFLEDQNI
jgi:hypothetical protein